MTAADRPLDVVALGSPLVDILARVEDERLAELELVKGAMTLVDLDQAEAIYAAMGSTVEVSGGSAANTLAGVAALGGSAGFVGVVADDELGHLFTHDLTATGVEYERTVTTAPTGSLGTGRCLVMVTGDAERTMATHLGAATTLDPAHVPDDLVGRASVLYLEGYIYDEGPPRQAVRRAVSVAQEHGAAVALTLSDLFCVERHRREWLDLVRDDLDVLFGNDEELLALFGASTFEAALDAAAETGLLVAVTRGALGSVVVTPTGPVEIPADPVAKVVDTTGAGDLFAAGFLYGLTHGSDPERCGRLGSMCAAEVISHLGARPQEDLVALAREAGLV